MNFSRLVSCVLVAGLACVASARAQDFDVAPILPIVPELSKDQPNVAPKAATVKDAPLENITFPSFPDESARPSIAAPSPAVRALEPIATIKDAPQIPAQATQSIDSTIQELQASPAPKMPDVQVPLAPEVPVLESQEQAPALEAAQQMPVITPNEPAQPTAWVEPALASESPSPPAVSEPSQSSDKQPSVVDEKANQISLGDFEYSLMFATEDMNTLKRVLLAYETRKTQVAGDEPVDNSEADLLAELLRNANGEELALDGQPVAPTILPAFYLGTIVFNHKGDWTLWVNQKQASPPKREIAELGITVRSVGHEYATLAWKPENVVEAKARWEEIKAAGVNAPREWKHREVRGARIEFDEDKQEFVVSMRANQTFYANSMQVFEGRRSIDVPVLAADTASGGVAAEGASANSVLGVFDPAGSPNPASALQAIPQNNQSGTGAEREAANKLINNLKTATGAISGITGGGSTNAQPSTANQ